MQQTTAGTPPLSLDQLTTLANRYAPIVRFHPDEPFFMCSIDWYLQHSTLYGPNGYVKESPTVADLPTGKTDDGKYSLHMKDTVKPGDLSSARTYVHAWWQSGNDYLDLQYWFCYGYNGPGTLHLSNPVQSNDVSLAPLGEHWVDWEQTTVRIKISTRQVLGVFLSQHGEGDWITDLTKFQRKNDQFIVYASRNGHALYAQPGANPTNSFDAKLISFYLRNDTADHGTSFDSASKLDLVAAEFLPDFTEPRWLHFPYRYGLGTGSHLTVQTVQQILKAALSGPLTWVLDLLTGGALSALAETILPAFQFDDTNGVYGPQTQSYWKSLDLPQYNIKPGYTGHNTNPSTPPSITTFKNQYHVFFQDHDRTGIMHISSSDGENWPKDEMYTGRASSSGPCSIVYENTLHVFYRDEKGNGILYIRSTDGKIWSKDPIYTGQNCDGQPSAAVLNKTLCVTAVGHGGNKLVWAVQSGLNGKWTHGETGYTTNASAPPCVVSFANLFHLFFQESGSKRIMHLISSDGVNWQKSNAFYTGFDTSAGPAAIVFNQILYVFYRDSDGNGMLYIQSTDGIAFSPVPVGYTGLNGDHEPAIAAAADHSGMCLACVDASTRLKTNNGIMRAVIKPW